jgi:quinone-modifying oxidoreductase subunit QmoC
MIWTQWGLKDRLIANPDVWLCYNCNDCSVHCPRGARPGDVLGAIRQTAVERFAIPGFIARWVNNPRYFPLLLFIPMLLLGLALLVRKPVENALGISMDTSERIVFANTSIFPHWLLNSFFFFFSALVLIALVMGIMRFWKAMKESDNRKGAPAKGVFPSLISALKTIFTHENFSMCSDERPRFLSHACVFFGFISLAVVSFWVVTARYNPLIQRDFVYIFGLWNPWKILANVGGAALVLGCALMIWERLKKRAQDGTSSYFDWSFLWTLFAVAATGFLTEALHYARMELHRYIAYYFHLVFVFALLMYLPYSKFAHLVYRATAMVYAEYSGRNRETQASAAVEKEEEKL